MGVKVWKQRHPTMPTLLKVRAMTKVIHNISCVKIKKFDGNDLFVDGGHECQDL